MRTGRIRLFPFFPILFVPLVFLVCHGPVSGQEDPDRKTARLWNLYRQAGNDSDRVRRLFDLAFYYNDYFDEYLIADSIGMIMTGIAERSDDPRLVIIAYNNYIESNNLERNHDKALRYGLGAYEMAVKNRYAALEFRTAGNLFEVYFDKLQYDKAYEWAYHAFAIARKNGNYLWKAQSYYYLGRAFERKNKKKNAFQFYMFVMDLSTRLHDTLLLKNCYTQLALFSRDNKMFQNAMNYAMKKAELVRQKEPPDSIELAWISHDTIAINVDKDNSRVNDLHIQQILDFAIRKKALRLKNYTLALYRRHLLDADKISQLFYVYKIKYPDELAKIQRNNPAMFYRLMGYFYENKNIPDSTIYYFNKVEKLLRSDPNTNTIFLSNFYYRYGQFYLRQRKKAEAVEEFLKANKLAESVSVPFYPYILNASSQIEKIYFEMQDYEKAYHFIKLNRYWTHISDSLSKNDEVIRMEISQITQNIMRKNEEEKQKIQMQLKQQRLQKYMMGGGIGFLFILSFVIFRSYRTQRKYNIRLDAEKKRSDNLLLNILPHETAEELKAKGSARAKQFDEVTVMFTDFRDFTQLSEKLTADDLVRLINFYYSEFDKIISQYPIEKIKIIGDSYMCAGGLPVSNETNPFDVVGAALELLAFTIAQKTERIRREEPYFELRIGIHTGPVVAGIVGLKKFAYDIWGDTVNTASRMESSGEINRVNISGATYERVKHRYSCTYRGKVQVKHKGEIDMYFVEGPINDPG